MKARIGISVSLEQADPARKLFRNKRLQYLEEGMIEAVRSAGGIPILLPLLEIPAELGGMPGEGELTSAERLALDRASRELLDCCDGLLLSGGSDVATQSYGQTPRRPDWNGDRRRDLYEIALVHAAGERQMPILGICRGCQILAVAHGASLWQDIETQVEGAIVHRDQELYDGLTHDCRVLPGTVLAGLVGAGLRRCNSVHHQAVRDIGGTLQVCALAQDSVIEAVELAPETGRFVLGLQWHPEWLSGPRPVLEAFVQRAMLFRQSSAGSAQE